jgi:hypothetical protein
MRKITQLAVNAFNYNDKFSLDNTQVIIDNDRNETSLYLHGNLIVRKNMGGLFVSTAGWSTPTTKERLNALNGVSVNTKKGQLYLNGKVWDGSFTNVYEWSN